MERKHLTGRSLDIVKRIVRSTRRRTCLGPSHEQMLGFISLPSSWQSHNHFLTSLGSPCVQHDVLPLPSLHTLPSSPCSPNVGHLFMANFLVNQPFGASYWCCAGAGSALPRDNFLLSIRCIRVTVTQQNIQWCISMLSHTSRGVSFSIEIIFCVGHIFVPSEIGP